MSGQIPRMDAHLRVQHGVLALSVCAALATGLALTGEVGASSPLHRYSGLLALALIVYHALALVVRSYVEGVGWSEFPLRLGGVGLREVAGEIAYLAGGRPGRPEAGHFRVSQKALYWGTAALVAGLGLSGAGLSYWAHLPAAVLEHLRGISVLHRGLALLLLGSILWHLYGVFTWKGCWAPEWSWLTGGIDERKAALKIPGFHREHLAREAERELSARDESGEAREVQRLSREKEEVQAVLEAGNRLAREERFVEALQHYRRALELYPGYSQARYNMARVLARMGERQMAQDAYRKFLEADPFHPLAETAQEALRELEQGGGR